MLTKLTVYSVIIILKLHMQCMLHNIFIDDEDSSKLCGRMWTSVMETLTVFLQLGHQQTLLLATPVFVKTWQVIAGKTLDHQLYHSVSNFISPCN